MSPKPHDPRLDELRERYEATGDEEAFAEARRLYEQLVAAAPDPRVLADYGYLLECHGRYALRRAVAQYERAIELDPAAEQPRHQLISAKAALRETHDSIALYRQRLAASRRDVGAHRLLASAYLAAGDYAGAARVVDAGLELAPDDRMLIEQRGDVKAATGDPDRALADWRRALDPDPHNIGGAYSSAFLLERDGRLEEAIEAWRYILEHNESRGYDVQAEWPRRELERLRGRLAGGSA